MTMTSNAWVSLCALHLSRMHPDVKPDVLGRIAYVLFVEHGVSIPPQKAALDEVLAWRQVEINRRRKHKP